MRAIQVATTGGPEVLRLADVPDPRAEAGEVVVRLEAIGVNFIEIYQRRGWYPVPLPYTPGTEGAGTVAAVGDGVDTVRIGDRVASTDFRGAYAEYAVAPADRVVAVPGDVTASAAAAVMLQGMTAHYLALSTYPLTPGDTCLVHAAAGGVGLLLCQLAASRGAAVLGTASTPEKAALARAAGAEDVVSYDPEALLAAVRQSTGGAGVSVVYDSVGQATFDTSLRCLAPRGTLVLFGQSSGPVPPVDLQVLSRLGSLFVTRPTLRHYTATREELARRASDVLGWVLDRTLSLRVDRELPLEEAAAAQAALEARSTSGKVLLTNATAGPP